MNKKPKFKLGDKVTINFKPNEVYEIVYYKDNDTTCGVMNGNIRYIEKVKNLTLIEEQYNDASSYGDEESDGEEDNREDKSSTEEYNDDDYDY